MKTLGKVLIFLVIGFFFQLVVVFIALQAEGDISGTGKGTYAIPYILCYVFAWIIVFKRKFPKFLFEENNEKPKEEIIPEIKQEIPKQEVNEQPLKKESVSSDSIEKSNINPFPILGIIVFVLAIIILSESVKFNGGDTLVKEIKSKADDTEERLESLIDDVLATPYGSDGDEIKTKLVDIIKVFPKSSKAYAILGYFQSRTSDEAKAVFNLTKAINMDYKYSYDLFFWRGLSKLRLNDKIGAKTDFQKSIDTLKNIQNSLGRKSAWIESKIGQAYIYLNGPNSYEDYRNSLKHFNKALEIFEAQNHVGTDYERALWSRTATPEIFNFSNFSWRIGDLNQDIYNEIAKSYKYNGISFYGAQSVTNDFCRMMSKAGEEGYKDAYKQIKKYCN